MRRPSALILRASYGPGPELVVVMDAGTIAWYRRCSPGLMARLSEKAGLRLARRLMKGGSR